MSNEYCKGCGHQIAKHYKDVKDVVRCLYVERGTSTRGIIGLPYEIHCDCENYVSAVIEQRKREEEEERQRWNEAVGMSPKKIKQIKRILERGK